MEPETQELVEVIERMNELYESQPQMFPNAYQAQKHYEIGNTITTLCEALKDRLAPNRVKDHAERG